jgi:hypothetical protein
MGATKTGRRQIRAKVVLLVGLPIDPKVERIIRRPVVTGLLGNSQTPPPNHSGGSSPNCSNNKVGIHAHLEQIEAQHLTSHSLFHLHLDIG